MAPASAEANCRADVLDRIRAMRSREETMTRCRDYSNPLVDAYCRTAMVDWCFSVVEAFSLRRESVSVAMSILDRYLTAGRGRAAEALGSRQAYQLAAVTSLFMAVKVHEPVQLSIGLLVEICRGVYKKDQIFAMERDILFSLEWRVCVSAVTPMEYVRHFLDALPELTGVADAVRAGAEKYMECATKDIYFSTCRTSVVGAVCLAGALNDTHAMLSSEKEVLIQQLNRMLEFELESFEARNVSWQLLSRLICNEPKVQPCISSPQTSVISIHTGTSSHVSVIQGLRRIFGQSYK